MVSDQATGYLNHLSQLEQFQLDDASLDAVELHTRVNDRQKLIDGLQDFDVDCLPVHTREAVHIRMAQIAEDTQAALRRLSGQFATLQAQKEQIVTARGAARGYRPDIRRASRTVNRKA